MSIRTPSEIIGFTAKKAVNHAIQNFMKNGIELEKGAIFTKGRIEAHRKLLEQYFNFWSVYPDCFIDLITPSTSKFKLFVYQRLFLRAIMRYGRICVIAPRALNLLSAR